MGTRWVQDTPPQPRSGSGNKDKRRLRSGHHHHHTAPARRERECGGTEERERRERDGAREKERELDGQGFRSPGILCRASFQFLTPTKRRVASLFIGRGKGYPRSLPNGPQRSPFSYGKYWAMNRAVRYTHPSYSFPLLGETDEQE